MPDPFAFQGFSMPPFNLPPPARETRDDPRVQFVPVPGMITPYGFCPLPMPVHFVPQHAASQPQPQPPIPYGRDADADVARAKAACPPGFTLKPAAEVYTGLLQKKPLVESHSFDQPNVTGDVVEAAPTGPMLEGLLPNGRQR